MPFLGLCQDDPVLTALQSVFRAMNIVRVPSAAIQPLDVVAAGAGREPRDLGPVATLIAPKLYVPKKLVTPPVPMGEVAGKRTKAVDLKLGIDLISSFLSGVDLGVLGSLDLGTAFKGGSEVSFTFHNVQSTGIPVTEFGHLLREKKLNVENKLTKNFLGPDKLDLLVIDSVVQSNKFSVYVKGSTETSVKAVLPPTIGKLNVEAKAASSSEVAVTFDGMAFLTFAFRCVILFAEEDGTIDVIRPDLRKKGFVISPRSTGFSIEPNPDFIMLDERVGMLDMKVEPHADK